MTGLTVADRCDACSAQALVAFSRSAGQGRLDLCGHHARRFGAKMAEQGFTIAEDHRESVVAR